MRLKDRRALVSYIKQHKLHTRLRVDIEGLSTYYDIERAPLTDRVKGVTIMPDSNICTRPVIILRDDLDRRMQRAVLAHEIGHIVLEHKAWYYLSGEDTSRTERIAWMAAAILLIPREVFCAVAKVCTVSELSALFDVPEFLVTIRAQQKHLTLQR
jgi:hypothetical protein